MPCLWFETQGYPQRFTKKDNIHQESFNKIKPHKTEEIQRRKAAKNGRKSISTLQRKRNRACRNCHIGRRRWK